MPAPNRRDTVESVIRDLVRIETENPPGNESRCAAYILDWFRKRDIDSVEIQEPDPQRPQVVARVGDGSPTLVLNGHMDVVPVGKNDEWEHDPYGAEIESNILYGRGSADMKAGLAIAMVTIADLADPIESGELDGSIIVQAAMGEETGEPGTKTLVESGYHGDMGVVLEPTNLQTVTSLKGLIWYDIEIKGTPCHASQPDDGANAITSAIPLLQALERYGKRVRERNDPLVGSAFATVTGLAAGVDSNKAVLPDDLTVTLDRRVLPDESVPDVDEEIDTLLTEVQSRIDLEMEWERSMTCESTFVPTDAQLANVFREHSNDVAGIQKTASGMGITADTRNLVNDAGMEAITWGPGDIGQAHSRDEHVDLDEVMQGLRILQQATRELLSS